MMSRLANFLLTTLVTALVLGASWLILLLADFLCNL